MSLRIMVTGAAGFIGSTLLHRLLAEGLDGRPVDRLVAVDLTLAGLPDDSRLELVEGSLADAGVLERCMAEPLDAVFHLASMPGGAAEKNHVAGRRVNLDVTTHLLDALRAQGNVPRLVFASSIAVYGESMPAVLDEDTLPVPAMSYGAHKLASEVLIADAARLGWVEACSLRLPGVVARPGDGAGLVSAFMSRLFWKLRAGKPIVLPVTPEGTAWWISVGACVDNLLHAAVMDLKSIGPRRMIQMPALTLTIKDVVDALALAYGDDRRALVSHEPVEMVQRLFASYPLLRTPRAEALGFRHDGTAMELVRRATSDQGVLQG